MIKTCVGLSVDTGHGVCLVVYLKLSFGYISTYSPTSLYLGNGIQLMLYFGVE
jgi:hypothetical protein